MSSKYESILMVSGKQETYGSWLLRRMGFVDPKWTADFLYNFFEENKVYKASHGFDDGSSMEPWIEYGIGPTFDLLKGELDFKEKKQKELRKDLRIDNIAATDFSNFTYCPVAYSLSKSFHVEERVDARIGTWFHGKKLLEKGFKEKTWKEASSEYTGIFSKSVIKYIYNSELLFSDTPEREQEAFINEEAGYVGKPDYIFKDFEGVLFVVEEKFMYHNREKDYKPKFKSNHIIQILSYLKYIKEYKLTNGYLVYWLYDKQDNKLNIYDALVLKVDFSKENTSLWNEVETRLREFITVKELDVNLEKLQINKCIACVVSEYCFHKTKKYKTVKLPYDEEHMRVYTVGYKHK